MDKQISYKKDSDTLKVYLSGRVDGSNASGVQKSIQDLVAETEPKKVSLITSALEYISSAGLRVLLWLRKAVKNVSVEETPNAIYDILEMTGFTELMEVKKPYRSISVDGCELLGQGANGKVYRLDSETVVKVYKNPDALPEINRERELARKAFVLGLPTAIPFDIVKVGNSFGSVFELLNARSMTKSIRSDPDHIDQYIDQYVELLSLIHSTEDSKGEIPRKKDTVCEWADWLKGHMNEELRQKYISLIQNIPETNTLNHGDYHINNVEMQDGEVMLIDMDTLSIGHPIFDIAGMYIAYVGFPELYEDNAERFFGLSKETCNYIWMQSTLKYAGSEARAQDIREKASLISYVYLSRWLVRHKDLQDAETAKKLSETLAKAEELCSKLDSLVF